MLGLTLEGGASRTVYSCGILDALLENDIMADKIFGVSAGSAFGVSYASRQELYPRHGVYEPSRVYGCKTPYRPVEQVLL